MNDIYLDDRRRHDFIAFFDVTDGNPNGDPDAGNLPRVDPETMQGLVTDVCLPRKIRNYVDMMRGTAPRFKIYVQDKGIALNTLHSRAYEALEAESAQKFDDKARKSPDRDTLNKVNAWMCQNFFDIRTFGAVMTTGVNCGQVRGPVQLTFARSISPIVPLDVSITRVAITRPEDAVRQGGDDEEGRGKVTEMGRKAIVPYALYRAHGFYNPKLAERTSFDTDDLALVWEALQQMWDFDRSASRGMMAFRGLYIFTHENGLGNAPAHRLFELVNVESLNQPPRRFADYRITVTDQGIPEGVTLKVIQ